MFVCRVSATSDKPIFSKLGLSLLSILLLMHKKWSRRFTAQFKLLHKYLSNEYRQASSLKLQSTGEVASSYLHCCHAVFSQRSLCNVTFWGSMYFYTSLFIIFSHIHNFTSLYSQTFNFYDYQYLKENILRLILKT